MGATFRHCPSLDHPMIQALAEYVCKELNVSPERLRGGDSRNRMLTAARHIIWWVLYDIGFYSYSELGRLFIMDRTTVISGVETIRTIIVTPLAICGKGQLYTPERKRLVARLATNARSMALNMLNRPVVTALSRETVVIPVCRVDLSEMENLTMTDLATRFSGGWLVELAEFARDPSRYPLPLHVPLGQEKESKFVWVIPTSYAERSESTSGMSSGDVGTVPAPPTTAGKEKAPSTSPETPTQPSTTAISKLQMQNA